MAKREFSVSDIRRIAMMQKRMVLCVALEFVPIIGIFLPPVLLVLSQCVALASYVAAGAYVFLLAMSLFGRGRGIFYGLVGLIPVLNLIVMAVINAEATRQIRAKGIRVGFFGADMKVTNDLFLGNLEVPEEDPLHYAGFWRRFGAFWIDGLVTAPLAALQIYLLTVSIPAYMVMIIPSTLFFVFYNIYFTGRWGATLGKMAMNVKVVDVNGQSVGFRQAFYRHSVELGFCVLTIPFTLYALNSLNHEIFYNLNFTHKMKYLTKSTPWLQNQLMNLQNIWIWSEFFVLLFNRRKRAIHDYIAGTVVVYTGPAQQPAEAHGALHRDLRKEIADHRLWLESNGESGTRGDFTSANFKRYDLRDINFSDAMFKDARLDWTDLRGTNFHNADLTRASLYNITLDERTDFSGTDLSKTFLDAKPFFKGNVSLKGYDKAKLPVTLHALWAKQNS